jgi:hypothetical protein
MTDITRRRLLQYGVGSGAGLVLWRFGATGWAVAAPIPGGTLDPTSIPKYVTPLVIPPAMPRTAKLSRPGGKSIDYYEIAVRQFQQHILPASMDLPTTVWSYGSVNHLASFNYPAFTIEAKWTAPVRVKWINQLVDASGNYLPHLLAIDQTLHWANPPGGTGGTDTEAFEPTPYTGPVPIVTHLHGGHSGQESDGFPEAWFLPAAKNIPAGYATVGSHYDTFKAQAEALYGQPWTPGSAVFQYANDHAAATLWYHDHTLGMTRSNVYAGPAGFYLLRGGPGDDVVGALPVPAPALGDPAGLTYYEIPIAIQDRSFNSDGSLFYPDNRAFFEGLNQPPTEPYLDIPFIPERACRGRQSDISPVFNPEFFGNTIVVNGNTWPYLEVEQRRYRFRFLNGCNSRFLILKLSNGLPFWQIGAEGGFLPASVELDQLLLGLAERADVIVDFTNVGVGTRIILRNLAPDEPFGGGEPPGDFDVADPDTTGQVMQFRVVPASSPTPALRPTSSCCRHPHRSRRRREHGRCRSTRRTRGPSASAPTRTATSCSTAPKVNPSARGSRSWAPSPAARASRSGGTTRSPRTRPSAPPRSGRCTTSPRTPTRSTSTRSPSTSSTARASRAARSAAPRRGRPAARTPSSPTPARSPASRRPTTAPGCSSGTATSSSTRTTK